MNNETILTVQRTMRPCWICGETEGELFPSVSGGSPYHQYCVNEFKADMSRILTTLMDCATPWHELMWVRFKRWLRKFSATSSSVTLRGP